MYVHIQHIVIKVVQVVSSSDSLSLNVSWYHIPQKEMKHGNLF